MNKVRTKRTRRRATSRREMMDHHKGRAYPGPFRHPASLATWVKLCAMEHARLRLLPGITSYSDYQRKAKERSHESLAEPSGGVVGADLRSAPTIPVRSEDVILRRTC